MANDGNGIAKRSPGGVIQFSAASKITFSTGTAGEHLQWASITAQWRWGYTNLPLIVGWVTSHTEADGELGVQQGDEFARDRGHFSLPWVTASLPI